jgi:rubrerythrin
MYVTSRNIAEGRGCGHGGDHRGRGGCPFPPIDAARPLNRAEHVAVLEALDIEQRAFAFHSAVLDRFPDAMPFARIVDAEERHVAALTAVLHSDGHAVPANRHLGSTATRVAVPASIACACDIAVRAEIAEIGLYVDRLLPAVAGRADLVALFTRLLETSRDRHLPAFRRWTAGQRFRGGVA